MSERDRYAKTEKMPKDLLLSGLLEFCAGGNFYRRNNDVNAGRI